MPNEFTTEAKIKIKATSEKRNILSFVGISANKTFAGDEIIKVRLTMINQS